jgi:hypothetical protein
MKENLKKVFLFTLTVLFIFSMIGCERSNTVASFVVSDRQYTERSDLEKAAQPEQLKAGKDVYLSVYFIESCHLKVSFGLAPLHKIHQAIPHKGLNPLQAYFLRYFS